MSTSLIFFIQITLVLLSFLLLLFDYRVVLVVSAPLSTVAISSVSNQTVVCGLVLTDSSNSDDRYTLNCTLPLSRGQEQNYPSGNSAYYAAIAAGNGFLCGLSNTPDLNVSIMRWWELPGSTGSQSTTTVKRLYRGPPMVRFSVGDSHVCGITGENRTLQCWRWAGFSPPALSNLIDVAVGGGFVCVLTESGSISCYSDCEGNGAGVVGLEPSGNFGIVAAGDRHACGLTTIGVMICWGVGAPTLPGNTTTMVRYTALALGENRTCVLGDDDTVSCWGEGGFSLPEKLNRVPFLLISGRGSVFCGVAKANYTLFCWGTDGFSSNYSRVFDRVLPGPCVSTCSDNLMEGSGYFCPTGTTICEVQSSPPALPPLIPPSPPIDLQPPKPDGDGDNDGGSGNKKKLTYIVVGTVSLAVGIPLLFGFLFFKYCKGKWRCQKVHDSGPLEEMQPPIDMPVFRTKNRETEPTLDRRLSELISKGHSSTLETFSFQMLLEVTDGFSDEKNIGNGSFGSVYYAVLDDGREVAIKRADRPRSGTDIAVQYRCKEKEDAFLAELVLLSRVNHRNLVRLLGFCREEAELVLIYDYMANGTLHDHLHKVTNSPISSWKTRIKVALDAARGIEYLHRYAVPTIIHRDIKSSNILIDNVWTAKVSDFGLCLIDPDDNNNSNGPSANIFPLRTAGTVGYMDPEYYRTQCLTTKSDVYSFGVVLLELLTGCKAIHRDGTLEGSFHGNLRNVVDFAVPQIDKDDVQNVLDPKLPPPRPSEIEAVQQLGYLAADCVRPEGEDRPDMKEVVNGLEIALEACAGPPLTRSVTAHSV